MKLLPNHCIHQIPYTHACRDCRRPGPDYASERQVIDPNQIGITRGAPLIGLLLSFVLILSGCATRHWPIGNAALPNCAANNNDPRCAFATDKTFCESKSMGGREVQVVCRWK